MNEIGDKTRNSSLLKYYREDQEDFLNNLKKICVLYREEQLTNSALAFGTEIEFLNLDYEKIYGRLPFKLKGWQLQADRSVSSGGELISPILHDCQNDWEELKRACLFIKKKRGKIQDFCGGHIHVGVDFLGNNILAWQNFLNIYMAFEPVITRFFYGEFLNGGYRLNQFAEPIGYLLYTKQEKINTMSNLQELKNILLGENRYHAINFTGVNINAINMSLYKNTIEFRSSNGSLAPAIWQNNINLIMNILLTARGTGTDPELLKAYANDLSKNYFEFKNYNTINMEKAATLADLVFTNNLDKAYFLRQYLKDGETSYATNGFVKSKKFYK